MLKICVEDGHGIKETLISMVINNLPNKKDTCAFYSEDTSGSISQVANIIAGMESGTKEKRLAVLSMEGYLAADLAMPRRQEIFTCFNRCRG